MGYTLHANGSLLRLTFMGDFTEADLQAYMQEFTPYLETATAENPIRFLVDIHQLDKLCSQARKQFTELNGNRCIDKVGIVGVNPFFKVLVTFILKASNRNNIQFVSTEAEALAWLSKEE
jgi:hypothetical protein